MKTHTWRNSYPIIVLAGRFFVVDRFTIECTTDTRNTLGGQGHAIQSTSVDMEVVFNTKRENVPVVPYDGQPLFARTDEHKIVVKDAVVRGERLEPTDSGFQYILELTGSDYTLAKASERFLYE